MIRNYKKITFFFIFTALSFTSFSQEVIFNNLAIKKLIQKKRAYNEDAKIGFKIQIYSGNERSARNFKLRFENEYPNEYIKLIYEQPDWKVHVGSYNTRLEADRALIYIKEKFSGAFIPKK